MKQIKILTIGQIAYVDSQRYFIGRLGNVEGVALQFSGAGPAVPELQDYVQKNQLTNVTFTGRYQKQEEPSIVETADMINIWLKNDINADSCMANRFYLCAQLRKPMIVNAGTYMADLCEEYKLGVVVKEDDDFKSVIKRWYENYEFDTFSSQCQLYLESVKQDIICFENKLVSLYRQ